MFLKNFHKIAFHWKPLSICRKMSENETFRKPRYDGRSKKRQWEDRRFDKGEGLNAKRECTEEHVVDRIKRRKYALLLGYSGVDYYGMQRNPTTKTIEEELFKALLNAKYMTKDAFNQVQTIQYQRAARTDKGVSAARQIVSLKLPEAIEIEKVNEFLPDVIRLFGYKRVTKGFNSKSQCDGRTYFYMLPTVSFAKYDEVVCQETYRLRPTLLTEINNFLNKFQGTKNFHNFTSKKKPNDPSANRYMMSLLCEQPFISNGVEFAILKLKGQSFMMHQIRKMVGLTLSIIRGHTTDKTFTKAFTNEKVNVPKAPGLGLVLDFVHYDRYNYRYGEDGVHEKLLWSELDETVKAFTEKYIYPTIVKTEISEKSMQGWLEKLATHNYDVLEEDEKTCEENEYSDDESVAKGDDKIASDKMLDENEINNLKSVSDTVN